MYWAAVKRVAKTDWFDSRQFLERLVCIRQGFYGKDFKSPPNCYNLIRHSEDEMDAYMKEAGDSFLSGSSVRGEVKLTPAVLVDEAVSAYLAAMKPGATLDELKHALKLLKPSNKKLTDRSTTTRRLVSLLSLLCACLMLPTLCRAPVCPKTMLMNYSVTSPVRLQSLLPYMWMIGNWKRSILPTCPALKRGPLTRFRLRRLPCPISLGAPRKDVLAIAV